MYSIEVSSLACSIIHGLIMASGNPENLTNPQEVHSYTESIYTTGIFLSLPVTSSLSSWACWGSLKALGMKGKERLVRRGLLVKQPDPGKWLMRW